LSNATVSVLDEEMAIATASTNDTCNISQVDLFFPSLCSTTVPTSSPTPVACLPKAQKVKLQQSSSGLPIQVFEVDVMNSTGVNVAEGTNASQSSTFVTKFGRSFDAYHAVDGDHDTFSHTNDANPWLEIDLREISEISSVGILNRWCRDSNDPSGCLCRLSGAVLSFVDNLGEQITSVTIGDTCGQSTLEYVFDPSPEFCLVSSVSFSPRTPSLFILASYFVLTSFDLRIFFIKSLHGASPSKRRNPYPWHERVLAKRPTKC
jgi:hypothetical protein